MGMMAPDQMMGGPPPGMGGPPPGMGGPPPGPPPGPPGGGGSETASFLREVIQHLNGYREIEQDDEDLAAVAKVMAMLQQILAKQQKEQDAAFGSSPASKVLRRLS